MPQDHLQLLKTQKIAVLIDAENLAITAKNEYDKPIKWQEIRKTFEARSIVRAIFYHPRYRNDANKVVRGISPQLRNFLTHRLGFEVKEPPKNTDCWLTIDAVALASKVDAIALFAGDGDYEPLAHFLRGHGVKVEVWSWPAATSQRLRAAADSFHALDATFLMEERQLNGAAVTNIHNRPVETIAA